MLVFRPSKISGRDASAKNPKEVSGHVMPHTSHTFSCLLHVLFIPVAFQDFVAEKATCVGVGVFWFEIRCPQKMFIASKGSSFAKDFQHAPSSFDETDDEEELLQPSSALVAAFGIVAQEEQWTEPVPHGDVEVPNDPFDEASWSLHAT